MARLKEPMTLTRVGEHWMDGSLYQDEKGRYYVDHFSAVESGKVNSVDILCPSDDPDGEPDYTLTGVIILTNPPSEHEKLCKRYEFELMMLARLKSDCEGFFSDGLDCRKGYPRYLWAGSVPGQVRALRDFYSKLPDDIKDAACMSKEEIDSYCKRLEAWAMEEFEKPKYDPVPATPRDRYHGMEILLDESLYYENDEGHLQKPDHIWFSSDSRRWHQDADETHGRAFTTYLSKKGGTVLAPVFTLNCGLGLPQPRFRRDDLCDVSCKVGKDGWRTKLYDFYHE